MFCRYCGTSANQEKKQQNVPVHNSSNKQTVTDINNIKLVHNSVSPEIHQQETTGSRNNKTGVYLLIAGVCLVMGAIMLFAFTKLLSIGSNSRNLSQILDNLDYIAENNMKDDDYDRYENDSDFNNNNDEHYDYNENDDNDDYSYLTPDVSDSDETENSEMETEISTMPQETENRNYVLPTSNTEYLTRADLAGLTAEQCRLARNEIYARHGRMFLDEELQSYFNSFDWYHPSIEPDDFQESMLNQYEIENRDLIVAYEKEQGYR